VFLKILEDLNEAKRKEANEKWKIGIRELNMEDGK